MQADAVCSLWTLSLWTLKPCLDHLVLHNAVFRCPASRHRPSRRQLSIEEQDTLTGGLNEHARSVMPILVD